MNNDDMNKNNTSLDNQNVINPGIETPIPQETEMTGSNPVMHDNIVTNVTSESVNEPTFSQYSSLDTMSSSTIQPDTNQINNVYSTNEQSSKTDELEKKKSGKNSILIGIIVLLVVAVVGVYVYLNFFSNISYKVYQSAVEKGISNIFSSVHNDNVFQYDLSLDVNIDTSDEVIPKEIRDLINKIHTVSTIQIDKVNHKVAIALNAKHENEDLLNANIIADINNNKAYITLPGLFDKYIETEEVDFKSLTETLDKKYDYKTIEKVLKREAVKLIKEEECTSENGFYIWKVNNKELINRFENLFKELKADTEFINAVGGEEEIENLLKNNTFTTNESAESFEITFKINDKEYDITADKLNISGTIDDDTVTFDLKQSNTTICSGTVTMKGTDNNKTISLSISSNQFGTIKVNATSKYSNINTVNDIDKTNVVKVEDITPEESQALMQKLQESKLYGLISSVASINANQDDSSKQAFSLLAKKSINTAAEYVEIKKLDGPVEKIAMHNKFTSDFNIGANNDNFNVCITYSNGEYKIYMANDTYYVDGVTYSELDDENNIKIVDSTHMTLKLDSSNATCSFGAY